MLVKLRRRPLNERRVVLYVAGRLDATTSGGLKEELKALVEDGYTQIIADLNEVPFIDSSGLAALVSGLKRVRETEGTLKIAGLNHQTRTVFTVTLLDRVFDLYPDTQAAISSFGTG